MSDDQATTEFPAIDPAKSHLVSQWKHARPLTACRFDPTGEFAFTGAEDNLVTRWSLAKGTPTPMAGHESWVRAIAFSPAGETVFTGGYDGRILSWETAAEKPESFRQVAAHDGWVRALTVGPAGKLLASCGNDRLVKVWDASDGKLLHELAGHESHVYNLAFHPSDGSLVSCDLKGNLRQWDLASGKPSRELSAAVLHKYDKQFRADVGGARSMAFSRDGRHLAVGGITNVSNAFAGVGHPAVLLLNWETGDIVVQHEAKEKVNGVAWGIRQHADGFWIGLGGGGGGGWLYFWRDAAAHEFFKLKLPDTGRDLDLHPDGTRVAVAHADGHLRLYALHAKPD